VTRQCQRPDCADNAAVSYRFDAQRQIVVLDRLSDASTSASGVLCARHASAMVLPKGWWLDDRRVARPSLFNGRLPPESEPVAVAPKVRRPRRARTVAEAPPETLPLEPDVELVAAGPEPQWTPDFDVQDDLDGLLKAESPLLSRAFGGRARKGKRTTHE
jgi:hypothetical protein